MARVERTYMFPVLLCMTAALLFVAFSVFLLNKRSAPQILHSFSSQFKKDKNQNDNESHPLDIYYTPLTFEEMTRLLDIAEKQFNCTHMVEVKHLRENFVWNMEILPPDKNVMSLRSNLTRQARLIIFQSHTLPATVQEWSVSMPSGKQKPEMKLLSKYPFHKRPRNSPEYILLKSMIDQRLCPIFWPYLMARFSKVLVELDCRNPCACLPVSYATPLVFTLAGKDRRKTWFRFHEIHDPFIQHPFDFQFLIDHTDLDPKQWTWEKIWTAGKIIKPSDFQKLNISQVANEVRRQDSGTPRSKVRNIYEKLPRTPSKTRGCDLSLYPVKHISNKTDFIASPFRIHYRDWSFLMTHRSTTGIHLFDVQFKSQRIIYEIGLMETLTHYIGKSPLFHNMISLETTYLMGQLINMLRPCLDCPKDSKYLDLSVITEGGIHKYAKNAACLFEWYGNNGGPMGRHEEFGSDFERVQYYYTFGNRNLILRYVLTLYNYDYIIDYIFYPSGTVQVQISPTGLIHTDIATPDMKNPYRSQLYGPGHVHMFHFKIDIDLGGGQKNYYERKRLLEIAEKERNIDKDASSELLEERILKREMDLVKDESLKNVIHSICDRRSSPRNDSTNFESPLDARDKSICYKIVNSAVTSDPFIDRYSQNSYCWAKHPFIITKHKGLSESSSTTVYNGVNIIEPAMDFCKFFENNDSIYEEDLVAWVAIGVHHVPRTEDLPNTQTVIGHRLSFSLVPNNYFVQGAETMSPNEHFYRDMSKL